MYLFNSIEFTTVKVSNGSNEQLKRPTSFILIAFQSEACSYLKQCIAATSSKTILAHLARVFH